MTETKPNEQTLKAFCKEMRKNTDRFEKWYQENAKKHADPNSEQHWPLSMGAVDWVEQFVMWLQFSGEEDESELQVKRSE